MKLHSITVKNVKSFKEAVTFIPNEDFNVLIGPNGSGKSNLMEIVYIALRHYIVTAYRWSNERLDEGIRYRIDVERQPFGQINRRLVKYRGDVSTSEITLDLKVTDSDVENINRIRQNKDALLDRLPDYYYADGSLQSFLTSEYVGIRSGQIFRYVIVNDSVVGTSETSEASYFFKYLRSIEGIRFLCNDIHIELYPIILYISPFRGVSDLSLEQSLADNSSIKERTEVMKSTSRSISSLIKLATLYFSEKRRRFEAEHGDWESKWNSDKEVLFVSSSLDKIGYSWELELVDASRNTYTIKLKKDGQDFLLNQASSGEVELINFILGLITVGLRGGIIIVDEPELHLHPKWIAVLRGFFMEYAFTEKNQLLIITHSASFINTSTYPYISRVFKTRQGSSTIHQVTDTDKEETKERLHFINATNNEKVFFSDFVIMVEGDTDEIVFRKILDAIKKEKGFQQSVEVMQVKGKTNYDKFHDFLQTLNISSCFIGDIDNIAQMAGSNWKIKAMLMTNEKRLERLVFKNPSSKDGIQLTHYLENAIDKGDISELKGFYEYMISRMQKLRPDLSENEKKELEEFVESLYDRNIFLLKKGEIEAYFPDGYKEKDLDKVLLLTQATAFQQWQSEQGYMDLHDLLVDILHRNSIL